jgi:hypothetical protein
MSKKRFQPATPPSCSAGAYLEPAVAHHSPDLHLPKAIGAPWGHPTLYKLEIRGIVRLRM